MQNPSGIHCDPPPPVETIESEASGDEEQQDGFDIIARRLAEELDRRAEELERRAVDIEKRSEKLLKDATEISRMAQELDRAELLFKRNVSAFLASNPSFWNYWTNFFFLLVANLFLAIGLFLIDPRVSFVVLIVPVTTTVLYAPLCYVGGQLRFQRMLSRNIEFFVVVFLIQVFIACISVANLVSFTILSSEDPMSVIGTGMKLLVFVMASCFGASLLAHSLMLKTRDGMYEAATIPFGRGVGSP